MSGFSKRLREIYAHFMDSNFLNPDEQRLVDFFKAHPIAEKKPETVLVQAPRDFAFVFKFYCFLRSLSANRKFQIQWIDIHVPFGKGSLLKRLRRKISSLVFLERKWTIVYRSMGGRFALSFPSLVKSTTYASEARRVFQGLKGNADVLKISTHGIEVGDLINDTYLRFRPAPTVNYLDPFLENIIERAMQLTEGVQNFFLQNRPDLLVTTYSSYIQHGILVRMALKHGIATHILGSYNQLVTRPEPDFPFHRRNFHHYREWLKSADPQQIEQVAGGILKDRFGGKLDGATGYMAKSAFSEISGTEENPLNQFERSVLLMGHDFFDSPHIYGPLMFGDFYEWTDRILALSETSPYQFFVKPHPNSLPDNDPIYAALEAKYPRVRFLPKSFSNKLILQSRVDYILTAYGTVAHEMAYHGKTVICCGQNPHADFDFCKTVLDFPTLKNILMNPEPLVLNPQKKEILEFVYVHNFRLWRGEMNGFPWNMTPSQALEALTTRLPEAEEKMQKAILEVDSI